MACLVDIANPVHGPIITVLAGALGAPGMRYQALLDTGAQVSHVSSAVIDELGLHATGTAVLHGATGRALTNLFLMDLSVIVQQEIVFLGAIRVSRFVPPPALRYEIILGRDVLSRGHFSLSLDGRFVFCV